MSEQAKTPGQVAYEAWSKHLEQSKRSFGLSWDEIGRFDDMGQAAHAAWEAAAQAASQSVRELVTAIRAADAEAGKTHVKSIGHSWDEVYAIPVAQWEAVRAALAAWKE